jgi:hypothetical protein
VQVPEVGWEIEIVVAVTGSPKAARPEDDEDAVVGLPNAETHDPTVTPAAVLVTVWSKVVVVA